MSDLSISQLKYDSTDMYLERIESLVGVRYISSILSPISVSFEERDIEETSLLEDIYERAFSESEISEKIEIMRTLNFLASKFQILFPLLEKEFGLKREAFLEGISKRLASQIIEAKKTGRKYTNGTVGSLKKIRSNGDFILEKIPYWAFGSTNVSLDDISYETLHGPKTLREIMDTIGERDEGGEFFLPNSLGVSVMIQLADGTVVAQERNNEETLTQRKGLVSSASGAVSLLKDEISGGIGLLRTNALAEVQEELGISTKTLSHFPTIVPPISETAQSIILRELGLNDESGIMAPCGVMMEYERQNPEVIFTLVLNKELRIEDIVSRWENADDKWESLGLVGITSREIEAQVDRLYVGHNLDSETLGEKIHEEGHFAGSHLLMSYLAWKRAIVASISEYNSRAIDIL